MAARRKTTRKKKATKRKSSARRTRKAAAKEMLVVTSKVKNAIRSHNMNVASDAPAALNEVLFWYIDQAAKRAAANGRKTVRALDFMAG